MSKSTNQKLKLLRLYDILCSKTDENHALTLAEIQDELEVFGIKAERKSLYDDFEMLRKYGVDVMICREKTTSYYIVGQKFELPELKVLVDLVQSSKFITHKKSDILIKKIQSLCSIYEANDLQRQVVVSGRVKTINEEVYYNVDRIYNAIGENKKIEFKYFEYDLNKRRVCKNGNSKYVVSPMALSWDDENYYMIAVDEKINILKHYRVDKMLRIEICDKDREHTELFDDNKLAQYSNRVFSMFTGEEEIVKIEFSNRFVGVVIDRFGKDVIINKQENGKFTVNVSVEVSPQFFGWLAGLGSEVVLISPQKTKEEYINHIKNILENQ